MSKHDFTREEFAGRLDRTRAAMERAGLDWLLVIHPVSMRWLIGQDNKVWFSWAGAAAGPAVVGSKSWSRTISGWPMRVVATLDQATVDRESGGPRRAGRRRPSGRSRAT